MPRRVALCEEFERVKTAWYTKRLPNLAAGMRSAIEVLDTLGPGLARVEDDTAAIWKNKVFVWLNEFSVAPTQ